MLFTLPMFYKLTPLFSDFKYEMSCGMILYKYKEVQVYRRVWIVKKKKREDPICKYL